MSHRDSTWLLSAIAALALVACSSGGDEASPTPTPPAPLAVADLAARGPHGVGITTATFVDTSRSLAPNGDFAGAPERSLAVDIWYPTAASGADEVRDATLNDSEAPYPLIVFAHGFGSSRGQSASYLRHLASRGYVVASIDFPGSVGSAPGGARIGAALDQPGDISFVIDELLQRADAAGDALEDAIDGERIGVTGHSLGGLTTLLAAYGPDRDKRIDAIVPLAPPACFMAAEAGAAAVPAMVIGGANDLIVNRKWNRDGYDLATAPKWLVELQGGDHLRFADTDIADAQVAEALNNRLGGEDVIADAMKIAEATGGNAAECLEREEPPSVETLTADRQRELTRAFATPFFDAYLKDDNDARAVLDRLDELAPREALVESAP